MSTEEKIVMSTCRSHCGNVCLLKLHVRDGVITRIETDDGAEPQYRACPKGRAYRQRIYDPDRITHPLKRIGPKGSGQFARISWDEALDTVVSQMARIRRDYGPQAIVFSCSGGDLGLLHSPGLIDKLLISSGGYTGVWSQISAQGSWFAARATYGTNNASTARTDLLNSRFIIMWGWNPADPGVYGYTHYYLSKAREAGIKIVVVDPRYTDSAAAFADAWIPIRPGTDGALAIAMAHVIITEGLQDQAFLDRHTIGFPKYRDYVLGQTDGIPKTPAWAEAITGVPAATTIELAREYATHRPAALMEGLAPGRSAYGEQFHRAAATLAAMTGNIGIHGGNAPGVGGIFAPWNFGALVAQRIPGGENPVDAGAGVRKDAKFYQRKGYGHGYTGATFYSGNASASRIHRIKLADAILKGKRGGYPADYKMLYLVTSNYVNQYADSGKIARALESLEFMVTQEQVMSSTARYADIILPANTFLERNDVTTGGVAPLYGYQNQAIESIGESKSHLDIVLALAHRLGISDFDAKSEDDWMRELVAETPDIEDYDAFKQAGMHKFDTATPLVSFEEQIQDPAGHPFPTPSGKIEIYSQDLADLDDPLIPAIPQYLEPWEGVNDALAGTYPLQLITPHTKYRAHSQFANVPWLRELYTHGVVINAADAAARGIRDGELVRVFNDRGEVIIPALVTQRIVPGVVSIAEGAWYAPDASGVDRGGCANVLTKDETSPGGAFCSSSALVQVAKA